MGFSVSLLWYAHSGVFLHAVGMKQVQLHHKGSLWTSKSTRGEPKAREPRVNPALSCPHPRAASINFVGPCLSRIRFISVPLVA